MLIVEAKEKLQAARAHAQSIGMLDQLQERLDYLATYRDPNETRCTLFSDWAEHSFSFLMEIKNKSGQFEPWFNGGLIFHPPEDSSGRRELSINLGGAGWQVHT